MFSELELTEKFTALVPPPQKNGVSYHGVLAPRHRFRNAVIPELPAESDSKPRLTKAPKVGRSRWLSRRSPEVAKPRSGLPAARLAVTPCEGDPVITEETPAPWATRAPDVRGPPNG